MDYVELHRQLLGVIAPWMVERLDLDVAWQHAELPVGHQADQMFACPEYRHEPSTYDHQAERIWRHLNSCQFLTYLRARPPRVSCPQHGVQQVALWAQAGNRFTNLFEALVIDILLAANVKKAAAIECITCGEAWHLMDERLFGGEPSRAARYPARSTLMRRRLPRIIAK